MTIVLVGALIIVLALAGTPLFILMGGAALAAFWLQGIDPAAVITEIYMLADLPALIAIPLFTFAGFVLARSSAPKRLIGVVESFLGWIPGSLALVTIVATAMFTAFTGASGVTIVALGGLLLPSLIQAGYSERFSLGLLTTAGSLGLLFPPSLPVILYGLTAGLSIDTLYLAGVGPGVLVIITLSAYVIWYGRRHRVVRTAFDGRNVLRSLRSAAWELPLPFVVVGGIYGGYFTATEASAITAAYVVIVEGFIRREVASRAKVLAVVRDSVVLFGTILIMLGSAKGLTNYFIDAEVPQRLLTLLRSVTTDRVSFLAVLNVVLLGINMLEVYSAIIIFVPLLMPVASAYGIDPIHLGIIFLLNLEIGYMIPPLALNIFIASHRFEKSLPVIYRAVVPFLVLLLSVLGAVTVFPELSLLLPGLRMR